MYGVGRPLSGPVQSSKRNRFSCQEMHCQLLLMLTCPVGKDQCKSSSMLLLNLEKGAAALGKQNKFASCLSKGLT